MTSATDTFAAGLAVDGLAALRAIVGSAGRRLRLDCEAQRTAALAPARRSA